VLQARGRFAVLFLVFGFLLSSGKVVYSRPIHHFSGVNGSSNDHSATVRGSLACFLH